MLNPLDLRALYIFLCIKVALVTDPACGSGNFLTESYIALRKLENQVIQALVALRPVKHKDEKSEGQIAFGGEAMGIENPIQVSIEQFFGIEINDFAVTVAKTALWIAESQMMKETEDIVHMDLDFLPLKTNAHIHEGNALRMDCVAELMRRYQALTAAEEKE